MSEQYGFYLTAAGQALASESAASGVKLALPSFSIGDGIWQTGEQRETLKHQLGDPIPITEVADGSNSFIPLITLVFPLDLGGVVINEIAIQAIDPGTNQLVTVAISKTPRTYLPDAGSTPWVTEQIIKVDVNFGYEGVVEIAYNPIATATIEHVNSQNALLTQQLQATLTDSFSDMTESINQAGYLNEAQVVALIKQHAWTPSA